MSKSFVDKCKLPVGIEEKRIQGGQLSASTQYNIYYHPRQSRLNDHYGWLAQRNDGNQWLQVII